MLEVSFQNTFYYWVKSSNWAYWSEHRFLDATPKEKLFSYTSDQDFLEAWASQRHRDWNIKKTFLIKVNILN